MLTWTIIFFVLAIIAAIFGFTTIAVAAAGVAKFLFFLFVVLFIATLVLRVANKTDDIVDKTLKN